MDAEWIIIILALGFSILSGVNKNKKKKAGSQGVPQNRQADEDDPWATIRKYIEDANQDAEPDEDEYEAPAATRPEPIRQVRNEQAPAAAADDPYTAKLNEYARRQPRMAASAGERAGDTPARHLSTETSEPNDIMDGFDLRKAVIYSEILKPKFEEL